jgi:hypothetical protein
MIDAYGKSIEAAWMIFGDSIVEAVLDGSERRALYADIRLVQKQEEENYRSMVEAARLLLDRIGGTKNLRSYVDTLMVSK